MLRGAQLIPRARIAPHASLRAPRGAWLVLGRRACAPANGWYSLSHVVPQGACRKRWRLLVRSRRACLSARDRASETASTSPPKAPQPQLRGFLRPQAPVFVCLPQVRSRETRYVCVLIAPGAVAPEASNTFPQVTAPRITPLATRRTLKRRRIAFPARLRPRARASLLSACGPARAPARLRSCVRV